MHADVDQLRSARDYVQARMRPHAGLSTPRIAVVLGSGLGAFADGLRAGLDIPYGEIPGMAPSAVSGHAGRLCIGRLGEETLVCLQGRVHLYEGHSVSAVVFGCRLLAELGCQIVLLTNAAGGVASKLDAGDLMLITDHINLSGHNPLVGPNCYDGPRFPDMSRAYDARLNALAHTAAERAARDLGRSAVVHQGVYAGVLGPSYETPAEIRMLKTLGADAVGMSTVNEVIALRHLGVRVAAVSCITNKAAGLGNVALSHADVEATAKRTEAYFASFLRRWVEAAAEHLSSPEEA